MFLFNIIQLIKYSCYTFLSINFLQETIQFVTYFIVLNIYHQSTNLHKFYFTYNCMKNFRDLFTKNFINLFHLFLFVLLNDLLFFKM